MVYCKYDADHSGKICSREVPGAFEAAGEVPPLCFPPLAETLDDMLNSRRVFAGFPLNDQLYKLIVRRYSDEHGDMDFDNFIGCVVRLDSMISESALSCHTSHIISIVAS